MGLLCHTLFVLCLVARVNGKLVALKVIRLQEEEGTPFTAIREGKRVRDRYLAWNTNTQTGVTVS